jgi:hypothetical protein
VKVGDRVRAGESVLAVSSPHIQNQ